MANLAPFTESESRPWPTWAKVLASGVIAWQVASLLATELTAGPASPLEYAIGAIFHPYYQLVDQGADHRFYSDIYPTPILLAELRFGDGRPTRTVRLPDRAMRPRLLYQRQLALAHSVFQEIRPGLDAPDTPIESRWARSFARHLGRGEPGCVGVTVRLQIHHNPDPGRMIAAARGGRPADADSEEFYDRPILVGDYPCETP